MSVVDPNGGGALLVPGGGASLPTATAADELLRSTGAGTTYEAVGQGDVVGDVLVAFIGSDPAGTAIISDGAGDITITSADVSAVLAAADATAARAALGVVAGSYGSGTLAARPASPAAGDTYAVTSGVATGDRYACFVATVWTLVSYDRSLLLPGTTPWAHWPLDEASGTFASVGSQSGMSLTGSGGTITYGVPLPNGRAGVALAGVAILTGPTTAPSGTRRCTLLGWLDYVSTGSIGSLLSYNASGSPYATISLGLSLSGPQVRGYYTPTANPSTHNPVSGTTATATAYRRRLYAAVWDGDATGAQLKLYVDGQLAYSGTPTAGTDLEWTLAGGRWYVGNNPFAEPVPGLYSDFAVYNDVALTPAQMREIYQRGVGGYAGQ